MKRLWPLSIVLLIWTSVQAQVGIHANALNNHWENHWVLSPAPEVTFSGKWFLCSADGTLGYFHPSDSPQSTLFMTRASLVPMLKLQLGPFFLAAGYGISHQYKREDWVSTSTKESSKILGEARALAGLEWRFTPKMALMLKGGYGYQDDQHAHVMGSVGLVFHTAQSPQSPSFRNSETTDILETLAPPVHAQALGRSVVFVGSADPVVTETNRAIEAALIAQGVHLFDWQQLKQRLRDNLVQQGDAEAARTVELIEPMDLAAQGGKALNIDVVIDTQLRYGYKSYGRDILLQDATVRFIRPSDGRVLWVCNYDGKGKAFDQAKAQITEAVLGQFRKMIR